ncbi:diaminopimelate epimerase [Janibacter alkaliphilus]|uniref:Diaminopimelate epimerase n=1 Tax=Janibacter alkaliphilus TaxID=1069963 RepID=A0A852X7T1_9MICO|nr:diaminopimelate epimerase [Janibacter alkaliphilus]NYG38488.1 diaminopimelate epimerase [Janibacter alkaliphilus]
MTGIPFTKGHGTENDFVLLPDLDGSLEVGAQEAALLADRHAGIGGDGVIRIVPTRLAAEDDVRAQADEAPWFMDYRNADGSAAQMCGNGTRVFAAWLRREGLVGAGETAIATRAGVRRVRFDGDHVVTHMGTWRLARPEEAGDQGFDALVHVAEAEEINEPYSALSLDLGNPHTVVALPPGISLDGLDLTQAPVVRPVPPEGTNVELVRVLGPGHLAMRVHERGVGETRSCGTGVCAAALAMGVWSGTADESSTWRVDVPGGSLTVNALPGQQVELAGPAALVADGTTTLLTRQS